MHTTFYFPLLPSYQLQRHATQQLLSAINEATPSCVASGFLATFFSSLTLPTPVLI